jgi:DNA transposition AAA+ family ATPase
MNIHQATSAATSAADTSVWQQVQPSTALAPGMEEHDGERMRLARKIRQIAIASNWSRAEAARRIDIANGTFSQWYNGSYNGRIDRVNAQVEQWLDGHDERQKTLANIPASPGFIDMKFSMKVIENLYLAQYMPGLVIVSADAGIGKTYAARHYAETNPRVHIATMNPTTGALGPMLRDIAMEIDLGVIPLGKDRLLHAIGKKLRRAGDGTLLIVDEAQNLSDECINTLRHLVDRWKCGVALLANKETRKRFSTWVENRQNAQMRSRVFSRLHSDRPDPADLATFITAHGFTDPDQVRFLRGIGMKDGALREVDATARLAKMLATGRGAESVTRADLEQAWANRDVEQGQ